MEYPYDTQNEAENLSEFVDGNGNLKKKIKGRGLVGGFGEKARVMADFLGGGDARDPKAGDCAMGRNLV
nr:hypothetical protein [uncultured Oscillibacter sp.]